MSNLLFEGVEQGACMGTRKEGVDFYARRGREQLTTICASCPVKGACLEYAIVNEPYGVWGGKGSEQRAAIRRERGLGPYRIETFAHFGRPALDNRTHRRRIQKRNAAIRARAQAAR